MQVQLNYLKNHRRVDVGPLLQALCEEVEATGADPTHLYVSLDWVQYKRNFRPPVDWRYYLLPGGTLEEVREIAIDVRRLPAHGPDGLADWRPALRQALSCPSVGPAVPAAPAAEGQPLYLEPFVRPSQSIIWAFNRLYWQHLSTWEAVFRGDYLAALPGGVSDGMNPQFWRERLEAFLAVLDDLDRRGLVPEEIFVLELGVGNGQQAKIWLDTFRALCAERGRDYFRRVRYLMSDYSADVLRIARRAVEEYSEHVSCLSFDATDPLHALAFLRYKVLFIHSCNLYDNLPTDEIARRNGHLYEVQVRAYLPAAAVAALCATYQQTPETLPTTIQRLLRIGPEYFDDPEQGVRFWAAVWDALRLEERYVLLEDPEGYRLAPGVYGVRLDDVLGQFPGDLRMHLSTMAVQSFVNTLPLLHPRGMFQVQDLFVTSLDQYRGTFRGPGKLDGSIVNWLNGPLLRVVGDHLGYTVHFEPFTRYRAKSNTVVLTTSQKE
jgi:hypothetical protein